jgi:hypothetical protein
MVLKNNGLKNDLLWGKKRKIIDINVSKLKPIFYMNPNIQLIAKFLFVPQFS